MTKAIVLYNSKTGNTRKVAQKIAEGLGDVECLDHKHVPELKDYRLVLAGSWVMMGRISLAGSSFLKKLQKKLSFKHGLIALLRLGL